MQCHNACFFLMGRMGIPITRMFFCTAMFLTFLNDKKLPHCSTQHYELLLTGDYAYKSTMRLKLASFASNQQCENSTGNASKTLLVKQIDLHLDEEETRCFLDVALLQCDTFSPQLHQQEHPTVNSRQSIHCQTHSRLMSSLNVEGNEMKKKAQVQTLFHSRKS